MSDDLLNDPNFPDRPQTPDFWRMVETSLLIDSWVTEDRLSIPDATKDEFDMDSMLYMAKNRVGQMLKEVFNAEPHEIPHETWISMLTIYLGAFTHGVLFQKAGGHRD